MDRDVRSVEDLLRLLDGLFDTTDAGWWDRFYADRSRPVPFFALKPDENLVSYLDRGLIRPGRALDVGCGPGRNALHLARAGFTVDAVDLSPEAISWASSRAREAGVEVHFRCGDVFAVDGTYDLIYDSGCFHHLPPHRRISYLALVARALAPGGHLALTCFTTDEGSSRPDADFYRTLTLDGGVGYTPDSLRHIFADLAEVEIRPMREQPADSPQFGVPFLWTALFRRVTDTTSAAR
ncbi:class I SAM-dependent methyltransferase [Kutzneria buriramensis]|uniref:Methyltransferase family protein n=1 Tax=Kutzneria buriramensis TaxID=1045776 RepID=A0A3E0HFJ1_9PSEU|nr:class I SAM-dependent methyltransferase [Kutzneria buriramensis]REH44560.1 methyltransferase family protein [Kutzneria buriramensis]